MSFFSILSNRFRRFLPYGTKYSQPGGFLLSQQLRRGFSLRNTLGVSLLLAILTKTSTKHTQKSFLVLRALCPYQPPLRSRFRQLLAGQTSESLSRYACIMSVAVCTEKFYMWYLSNIVCHNLWYSVHLLMTGSLEDKSSGKTFCDTGLTTRAPTTKAIAHVIIADFLWRIPCGKGHSFRPLSSRPQRSTGMSFSIWSVEKSSCGE